jgi:nitrite reductase/ring-hydroxylating ferredoxin subunit
VTEFVTVARAEELRDGELRPVRAGDLELALARVDGQVYALQGRCEHLQGPLGHGGLEGCVLSCPWHGWQYDVRTGENEFDRAIKLETYEVQVADGEIRIAL